VWARARRARRVVVVASMTTEAKNTALPQWEAGGSRAAQPLALPLTPRRPPARKRCCMCARGCWLPAAPWGRCAPTGRDHRLSPAERLSAHPACAGACARSRRGAAGPVAVHASQGSSQPQLATPPARPFSVPGTPRAAAARGANRPRSAPSPGRPGRSSGCS